MLKKSIPYLLFFLFYSSNPVFAESSKQCKPPYKPNNILTVILNYSEGMNYISQAEKKCSKIFARKLINTSRDSILMSQGCLEVTLHDIRKAIASRKSKSALNKVKGVSNRSNL